MYSLISSNVSALYNSMMGIGSCWKLEAMFRQQVLIIAGLTLGGFSNFLTIHWTTFVILAALCLSLEMMNSSIENICDKLCPEWSEDVKNIKDMSSGSVFIVRMVLYVQIIYCQVDEWFLRII